MIAKRIDCRSCCAIANLPIIAYGNDCAKTLLANIKTVLIELTVKPILDVRWVKGGEVSWKVNVGRVLIVDDNQDMAKCLADMAEEFDVQCDTVSDGEKAVELLGAEKYRLVIADTQMPGMSGFSLLRHIKEKYPDLPVALISTRNSEMTKGLVVQSRADYYLPKPFTTSDIGELLEQIR
jgi:CheY-like chemotaxis protein